MHPPLRSPTVALCILSLPRRARVFWFVVAYFQLVGSLLRPRRVLFLIFFLLQFDARFQETTPPHTFLPGRLSSPTPPLTLKPTSFWLLCPPFKWRPCMANGTPASLKTDSQTRRNTTSTSVPRNLAKISSRRVASRRVSPSGSGSWAKAAADSACWWGRCTVSTTVPEGFRYASDDLFILSWYKIYPACPDMPDRFILFCIYSRFIPSLSWYKIGYKLFILISAVTQFGLYIIWFRLFIIRLWLFIIRFRL